MAQTDFLESDLQEEDQDLKLEFNDTVHVFNEWCPKESSDTEYLKFPWYPDELIPEIKNITMSNKHKVRNTNKPAKDAFTRKLQYKRYPIRIQTPILKCMFGIQAYRHPVDMGTVLGTKDHYSIHLGLKETTEKMQVFKQCLQELDKFALGTFSGPPESYCSAVRYNQSNKDLPPVLRCKILNVDTLLMVSVYTKNDEYKQIPFKQLCQYIKHGTEIQCIIEINGLWKAGDKHGLSYKVVQIKILSDTSGSLFREE